VKRKGRIRNWMQVYNACFIDPYMTNHILSHVSVTVVSFFIFTMKGPHEGFTITVECDDRE
jgi:hypothetical protein